RSDGRVNIPFLAPRAARYQIARFCQWESPTSHEYRYRLTPASLIDQGLKIQHLQTLLARHAQNVPPNIVKALTRWDQRGTEARLQTAQILRLGSPELLKALRNSRAARYLGEPLGPTTVIVKPGAGEKVLEALTEMGHLGEIDKNGEVL
ncbi:helicase-associated domain-containing protein, partial [Chloroflexota bacterium]